MRHKSASSHSCALHTRDDIMLGQLGFWCSACNLHLPFRARHVSLHLLLSPLYSLEPRRAVDAPFYHLSIKALTNREDWRAVVECIKKKKKEKAMQPSATIEIPKLSWIPVAFDLLTRANSADSRLWLDSCAADAAPSRIHCDCAYHSKISQQCTTQWKVPPSLFVTHSRTLAHGAWRGYKSTQFKFKSSIRVGFWY